jgi:hypothetical protein
MPNEALPDFSAGGSSRFVAAIGLTTDEVTATSARGGMPNSVRTTTPRGA